MAKKIKELDVTDAPKNFVAALAIASGCSGCHFNRASTKSCGMDRNCTSGERKDGMHVIFVRAKKIKPAKMQPPKQIKTDKMHPLPWTHVTDPRDKRMSAVVDLAGKCVVGSLICQQQDHVRESQTHAFIVEVANRAWREGGYKV